MVVRKSGNIQLIAAPNRPQGELSQPGQCLAVLATTPGVFDIVVEGFDRGAPPHASFAVDLLDRGGVAPAMADASEEEVVRAGSGWTSAAPVSLTIQAHVSRLGDVRVGSGEWVAGPERPLPIEGLTVSSDRDDVGLEIQTRSERAPGEWSAWKLPGQFAGTKQKAESLTGLRFRLTGRGADDCQIAVEALFLGSSVVRKVGRTVDVSGYDPLVGLKLEILPTDVSNAEKMVASGSQVRVFRARGRG